MRCCGPAEMAASRARFVTYHTHSAWLFLAVPLLLFTLFRNLPLVIAFIVSLQDWGFTGQKTWVGFQHYVAVWQDPNFRKACSNTLFYVIGTVPPSILIGLLLAVGIESHFLRFKFLFRTMYFLPVVSSMVAVATVWNWLYNPIFGLLNAVTSWLGWGRYGWLADPKLTMPSIMAMSIWKTVGYNMVIYVAGLKAISGSYYEAASLDGASKIQMFTRITWPLLRPVTFFLVVMGLINSFQVFDQVYVMSQGQLKDSTNVLVFYLYHKAFNELNMGYASAVGYYIFMIIMAFTAVQFWWERRRA